MPASAAPNVGLNYGWSVGESGWGAGQSYNLFVSDWFLQPRVLNITNTPPGSPSLGDAYVCGTSPTGAWSGKANQIAIYYSSSWYFFPAKSGWSVYNVADGLHYQFSGSVWQSAVKAAKITNSGASPITVAGNIPTTQLMGNDGQLSSTLLYRHSNDVNAPNLYFVKGRSATAGDASVAVASSDIIGRIWAAGSDTSIFHGMEAVSISAAGTWSGTSTPFSIDFYTTETSSRTSANRMRVASSGNVLIGTLTDDGVNNLQVNGSAIINNNAKVRGGAGISLLVGSDAASNLTITNETQKNVRIAVPHYTNAEEPAALFFATINSSANDIHIGGGSSLVNAATSIKMETAANNTTTSGTVRFHVNSAGRTLIGPTLPTDDGVNAVQINGAVTIATGNTYKVNNVSVVGARDTGWAAMTGTTNKATAYDTSTVTLPQLAGRVMALQAALTTHGLLGT